MLFRWLIRGIIVLALVGIGVGIHINRKWSGKEGKILSPAIPEAAAAQDLLSELDHRRGFVGAIVARQTVDLSTLNGGKLDKVHVQLGVRVTRGQIIASLDAKSIEHQLDGARAAMLAASANRHKASLQLRDAVQQYKRRTEAAGTYSKETLSTSRTKKQLAAVDRASAHASVASQAAQVSNLNEMLRSATIRAPFAGKIAAIYHQPGTLLKPGQPIARIIASDDLWVRFAVPKDQIGQINVERRVKVKGEGTRQPLTARVRFVAPEVEPASQMIFVEAKLDPIPVQVKKKVHIGDLAHVFLIARAAKAGARAAPTSQPTAASSQPARGEKAHTGDSPKTIKKKKKRDRTSSDRKARWRKQWRERRKRSRSRRASD